ncbi:hypothetical protein Vqi01_49750 [Micromonospora qiuiae]|uniref:Uncharacterized protein n=1 Tax=Micromonospora qiuiae TaxID=502268 RepID=A0ABQ4JGR5_9ACTN|nr:hypothetical protein Vqi01_49750 [Micromonospora qiuiae]
MAAPWLRWSWVGQGSVERSLPSPVGAVTKRLDARAEHVYRQGPAEILEWALTQTTEIVLHLTIIDHRARPAFATPRHQVVLQAVNGTFACPLAMSAGQGVIARCPVPGARCPVPGARWVGMAMDVCLRMWRPMPTRMCRHR